MPYRNIECIYEFNIVNSISLVSGIWFTALNYPETRPSYSEQYIINNTNSKTSGNNSSLLTKILTEKSDIIYLSLAINY